MGKFLSFKAASDELDNLQTLNADLQAENETVKQVRDELAESNEALAAELAEANTEKETAEAKQAEISQELAGALEDVTKAEEELTAAKALLETFPDAVDDSARELVATIGHEPVADIPDPEDVEESLSELEARNQRYSELRKA